MKKVVSFWVLVFLTISANGIVRLPAIISDGMVLQQKAKVSLWGWGQPLEKISVYTEWNNCVYSVQADAQGCFCLKVATESFGGPYKIVFKGNNTVTVKDVLIGEVWLSAGQSNMEWTLQRVPRANEELQKADYPHIRLFKVPRNMEEREIKTTGKGAWVSCDSLSAATFSAISFYFARKLHTELNHIPIGIINASWGGTSAECWISTWDLSSNKVDLPVIDRWNEAEFNRTADSILYHQSMQEYEIRTQKGEKVVKPQPAYRYYVLQRPHRRPGILFNGMIYPLIPYTVKGFIWYQGTSNREYPLEYGRLMETLIGSWRKYWQNHKLPFYFLQLSSYNYEDNHKAALLREQQLKSLKVPYTMIGSTLDIGVINDIHPPCKEPYGERFACMALNDTYHRDEFPLTGPLFKGYRVKGDKVEIHFKYAQGLKMEGDKLESIFIAGEDKIFLPANAIVENDKLIVFHPSVKHPKGVRYGWEGTDKSNLYNQYNLPACAFRTDNWNDIIVYEKKK